MHDRYSLTNATGSADATGPVQSPNWFRPAVDPADIRKLMQKSDAIALRDTLLWLGLMVLFAGIGVLLWPSWWSAPFWLAYGVLYGSGGDSRWHECGHQTAFRTPWMNAAVYQLASFMMMRNPAVWRSSHVRHHTDTIIVGRDPEIVAMRPPDLWRLALNLIGLLDVYHGLRSMLRHASGHIDAEEASYVSERDYPRVFRTARIWIAIYAATVGASVLLGSWLPLMVIGLPRLYGAWHHVMTGLLQHLGLAENVTDHRLNTRTVLMNPVSRFIYLNMNYHLEHHMFTMVPYYNLPRLHALIAHDTPRPERSIGAAYRRLLPVLFRQLQHKEAVIIPDLPAGAAPYRSEVDSLRPHAVA